MGIFTKEVDHWKGTTLFFMELIGLSESGLVGEKFYRNFRKDILKYKPYEINFMLIEHFGKTKYNPSSNIHQQDNPKIISIVQDILLNFDAYMTEHMQHLKFK